MKTIGSIVRRAGAQALLLALLVPGVSFAQQLSNTPPIYNIGPVAPPGSADTGVTCIGSLTTLGCTSNDISVALVNTSGSPISCVAGKDPIASLQLTAQWQSTANQRYNLGVWIATDGKDPSVPSGSGGSTHCDVFGTPITPLPWSNSGSNVCGDLAAATAGPATTYNLPHTVDVPCIPNAAGTLVLSNVATWDNSAGNGGGPGGTCTTATDLNNQTSTKCTKGSFTAQVIGSLIIKKVAAGGGATTFPFTSNGTPSSFTLSDGTQQLIQTPNPLSATAQAVTATEGATPGWGLTSITCVDINGASAAGFVAINQATGVVTASLTGTNPSATCTYTNTNTAVVNVSKTVTGTVAGYVAASTFPITVNCGAGHTQTFNLINGGNAQLAGIPPGTSCTVSEGTLPAPAPNYAYGTPGISNAGPFTTVAGGSTSSIVTNTLARQTGSLTVTKVVTGPGSSASQVTGSFPFSVDCGGDGTFTGSVAITAGATNSSSVPGIPAGASCTVTETGTTTAPAGFSWSAPMYTGNPATIPVGTAATVTITNPLAALPSGSISVAKSVVGGPIPAGSFSITVACPANGAVAAYNSTQTVTGGNSVIFSGVPTPNASDCSVTESATLPTPPTNYAWDASNTPPAALTAVSVGDSVTVTNTLVRQTSTITINKTVTGGPGGGVSGAFNFSAECGADDVGGLAGNPYPATIILSGASFGSSNTIVVPAGATCTVSETSVPGAPTNYAWGATPPVVVLTTTAGGPNTANFTNPLNSTFVPVSIPVPTLESWVLMLLGAMLLLLGVYVQQRKSKD